MPVRDVVEDLLGAMTTTQKVGQLNQRLLGWNALRRTAGGFAPTEEPSRRDVEAENLEGAGVWCVPREVLVLQLPWRPPA